MSQVPQRFKKFFEDFPAIGDAYKKLSHTVSDAGPLDEKSQKLIKLGIAVGARMEGAVHSHVRKCLEFGISKNEIRHAVLQATTTIGFPNMMAAMSWVDDILSKENES